MHLRLPAPVVDAGWLAEHIDEVTVVDVRGRLGGPPGRESYLGGHLPGAHFLDLDADLASPPTPQGGRHPLPSPQAFAAALGRLGIADGTPVVAYDDASGSTAGRLWWLLTILGEPAALLDGGIVAWTGELTTSVPTPAPAARTAQPWPTARIVDADGVAATVAGSGVVLDARAGDRYREGNPNIDPRPGHVPGARSAPWEGNVDPATGRFLPADVLRARFEQLGVTEEGPTIVYCGSGVTACHDLLALELAGFTTTALFPGSWSAWGADHTRPAETGADPAA
jgi:thiosulfate/3-mercaptopyruvate sulfurtransferase